MRDDRVTNSWAWAQLILPGLLGPVLVAVVVGGLAGYLCGYAWWFGRQLYVAFNWGWEAGVTETRYEQPQPAERRVGGLL